MIELKSHKNLFHSKVVFDFLKSPTFRKALNSSSLAKVQAQIDHYKHFSQGRIDRLEFQERAIADACRKSSGLWCGELWTGAGKSIIAARVALKFLGRGKKVIFICPNRTGIGSVADGIIQKFHRTFEHYKATYRIGSLDAVTLLDDVHFFTPHAFVRMARTGDALFKKLISEAGLLIVDEAHHFPEDPKDDQVIYGKIEKLASKYFLSDRKKVVTLTATHGRHDGKPVFKKERPDFQITVNEAVQAGWCPEIHGLPVYLDVKAPRATQVGGEFYLNLKGKQLLIYLRKVAAVMLQIQKANPGQQFCAFVRTIREAKKLQEIWNYEAKNLGFPIVVLLIGTMPGPERIRVKQAIQNREYVGYITCDVGSESIDIPRMETVHLIRRTKSINRLVQSIGRVLRNHPEKRRALVVDYNLCERRIIRACQGLEAYAKYVHSRAKKFVSGGPLVPIKGTPNADFEGISIGEERGWVERRLGKPLEIGRVFDWLTVLDYQTPSNVICRCKCGKKYVAERHNLLAGRTKSCGCRKRFKRAAASLQPGTRFGRLVVEKYLGCQKVRCKCDCGLTSITSKYSLQQGFTKSCGCLRSPKGVLKAGRRIGKVTVLKDKGYFNIECRCDCGTKVVLSREKFRKGNIPSCGCFRRRYNRALREGRRFHRLEVLEDTCHRGEVFCLCDCGSFTITHRSSLVSGSAKSCGCLRFDQYRHRREGIPGVVVSEKGYSIQKRATFGSLTVLQDNGRCGTVECKCICGKIVTPDRWALVDGKKKSCGCRRGRLLNTPLKHGRKFNKLLVLEDRGPKAVFCLCTCGRRGMFRRKSLLDGHKYCCGAHGCSDLKPMKNGTKKGSWTVVRQLGKDLLTCRCTCGQQAVVSLMALRTGASKSCHFCQGADRA